MSGGPVLNDKGELVGIHGRGDATESFRNLIIKIPSCLLNQVLIWAFPSIPL